MDRKEIKELAKSKISGNIWNILWPMLIIMVISSVLTTIFNHNTVINIDTIDDIKNITASYNPLSSLVTIIVSVISAGYIKYILDFVRTGNFDSNTIINTIKEKWVNILIANILTLIIVTLCTLILIVPGIIMAIAYTFTTYLVIDTDISGNDSLKKSREMMKGYKLDYFIFLLSFIGWAMLIPFTLGLILIWLIPYISVANTIYYEKLKEKTQK